MRSMTPLVRRAYRYRCYPTDARAQDLMRTFGCVRLVYNEALDVRARAWAAERRRISYGQTSAMLSEWKRDPDLAFQMPNPRHERIDARNRRLARAIADASWSPLRAMLEYKTRWYGRNLVVIDRWYPSSKLCSACGRLAALMPLNEREWTCCCGASHDRDVNAAKNILAAGLTDSNACGGTVRPHPRRRGRHGLVKQEPPQATAGIPAH